MRGAAHIQTATARTGAHALLCDWQVTCTRLRLMQSYLGSSKAHNHSTHSTACTTTDARLHEVVVDAVVLGQHHLHLVPLLLHSAAQRSDHIAQAALLHSACTAAGQGLAEVICKARPRAVPTSPGPPSCTPM